MNPILGGALIEGGSALLGGALSSRSNAAAVRRQIKYQKEFAQHGIRWRVADAKAAGLHPLYALGANTPGFSPVMSEDAVGPALASAGQSVGRAIAATQTAEERALTALTLKQAMANIARTEAETALFVSEARRNQQVGPSFPSAESMFFNDPAVMGSLFGLDRFTGPQKPAGLPSLKGSVSEAQGQSLSGRVTPVAPDLPLPSSSDPYTQAGAPPLWREFKMADGLPITLPATTSGDPSEALESISESLPMLLWVYEENRKRYGDDWARKFRARYLKPKTYSLYEYLNPPKKPKAAPGESRLWYEKFRNWQNR